MIIYEIGTGYTSIPAQISAATEIVVEELTKSLLNMKANVRIVDIRDPNRRPNSLPITEVTIPDRFLGTDKQLGLMHKMKRVIYSVCLVSKLKEIINNGHDEKIIFHFHNQYNIFFFLLFTRRKERKKVRIVYTNHNGVWRGEWSRIRKTIYRRFFQEVYGQKKSDAIFVLNQQTKENLHLHLKIKNEKIKVITNGVNTEVYKPLSTEIIAGIKKKLEFEGKKVIIQVGSVYDWKNQLGTIQMLEEILKGDKNLVYAYAGGVVSQEYKDILDEYVVTHDLSEQVKYMGELEPGEVLNEFYNIGEAFAFPSKIEAFSLVVIEAMSAGIPVIYDRELELDVGEGSIAYSSPSQFDEIIKQDILCSEHRKVLAEKARQSVKDRFCWDAIAKKYLDFILKTVD